MGSIFLYVHVSINKMKTLLSIIFFASIFNWNEGAPFSKLSSHDAIHSGDICKRLELQESEHHLLADPDDCKKFFSCQYSRIGWLAYSMSCADGTHFDGVYCVTGDCPSGINLVITEDPTPKYDTTTTKSSSSSTTTEVPTTTKFTTTDTTTEEPTTNIITEIPTTTSITTTTTSTTTTGTTTSSTTTEEPTTTIITEILSTS